MFIFCENSPGYACASLLARATAATLGWVRACSCFSHALIHLTLDGLEPTDHLSFDRTILRAPLARRGPNDQEADAKGVNAAWLERRSLMQSTTAGSSE